MATLASHAWKQDLVSERSGKGVVLQGKETLLTIPTEVQGALLRSTDDRAGKQLGCLRGSRATPRGQDVTHAWWAPETIAVVISLVSF